MITNWTACNAWWIALAMHGRNNNHQFRNESLQFLVFFLAAAAAVAAAAAAAAVGAKKAHAYIHVYRQTSIHGYLCACLHASIQVYQAMMVRNDAHTVKGAGLYDLRQFIM